MYYMESITAVSSSDDAGVADAFDALRAEALLLRREIVEALQRAGGGHYGGCLSVIDIVLTLYRTQLQVFPRRPRDPGRDRFILSKGHAALALYAVLRRLGFISDSLEGYADFASPLEGHPDMTAVAGVDFSTGSLGQGLSVGLGMAHSLRRASRHVWVVLGDGECQEGQVWEAAMLAAVCKLENLHAVIDSNGFQEWGYNTEPGRARPPPICDLVQKWRAFGWAVFECDGHDFRELNATFAAAKRTTGQPSMVIAHTVKGKGVRMIQDDPQRFHCCAVSDAEHRAIMDALSHDEAR
jgi:transketolase